ncbi:MAG: alpha/beta hydrolase family protein [Gemmataceae bacterium]
MLLHSLRPARFALVTALVVCSVAGAQDKPPAKPAPGDAMFEAYLKQETAKLSQRFMDGATTRAEWEAKRDRLKREYFDMLGLWPLPEKTPLQATLTGKLERGDVVIEKLHFQSKLGLYVTGNLYRPKNAEGKLPTILYVCGHSNKGRDGNKTAFQDHGMWFASNGYVCLIIDTLQLGEVPGKHHGTYNLGRWWWQALGYTPAGVECWNGIRAIDYLLTRPDVDPQRIGVTGISGGGAATIWIAAADERVKVAVPVSGMSDLESYVSNKIINGHCDCMLMVNTYKWEWTTIAALIAPRAMLFANSDNDPIFPMDGNRRIIERLRKAYAVYEKPDLIEEYVSQGGHAYRPDLRLAIFKFINKHLKNDTGPVKDADFPPIAGADLRVFREDKDVPADALNGKIDETFVPQAKVELPAPGKFEAWKEAQLKELRAHSFRGFPERVPPAKLLSRWSDGDGRWTTATEQGIRVRVRWDEGDPKKTISFVVLGAGDGTTDTPKWVEDLFDGEVDLLSPRGHGLTAFTQKNPPNYFERAHVLLGQTVDEMRVWDAIACYRDFSAIAPQNKWRIAGRRQAGIIAAYAALMEPDIREIALVDPPSSHRDGPYFLNVLRILDIPEALGLLAPKPLTIYSDDKAFNRTAEIYERAGAADRFKRMPSKK